MARALTKALGAAGLAACLAGPAAAQLLPPGQVPGGPPGGFAQQDAANLAVRIDRLENQIRALNGQIEQLQFNNRRLEDTLRKFQQDVEFRLQGQAGAAPRPGQPAPQRRGEADAPPAVAAAPSSPGGATPQPAPAPGAAARPRRNDAFDPAQQPGAPGAPRQLGATAPSAPLGAPAPQGAGVAARPAPTEGDEAEDDPAAGPLDLSRPGARPAPRVIPGVAAPPAAQAATPATPQPAGAAGPREEFNTALELYRAGQYESAETGLKSFLVKNPKSRLAPDAIYYLGETYFQRGRHREAADQYLKIATEYAQTSRAPDSMLRLGLALQAMGAKEQACATLGEIARKYPAASAAVRGADREMKRARC